MKSDYVPSHELLDTQDTVVVVVDVQEKLLPHVFNHVLVERNVGRIVKGANLASVPVISTEQYPKGLGATVESVRSKLPNDSFAKLEFSCMAHGNFRTKLIETGRPKVLLCGLETHVCVQQTAFDLLSDGYRVYLAADAIGARNKVDHDFALARMEANGVVVCTVESSLFEWCREAGTDLFKEIRKLVVE